MTTLEQIPQYSLKHLDDGQVEKLRLEVQLPGVRTATEIAVFVTEHHISVHVPGRYRLDIPLDVRVKEKPDVMRFVKKHSSLKAELKVIGNRVAEQARQGQNQPAEHTPFLDEDALKKRETYTSDESIFAQSKGSTTSPVCTNHISLMYAHQWYHRDPRTNVGQAAANGVLMNDIPGRCFSPELPLHRSCHKNSDDARHSPQPSTQTSGSKAVTPPWGMKKGFLSTPDTNRKPSKLGSIPSGNEAKPQTSPNEICNDGTTVPDKLVGDPYASSETVQHDSSNGWRRDADLDMEPEDIYANAKEQMNREAAKSYLQKSLACFEEGKVERATYLLDKAAGLVGNTDDQEIHQILQMVKTAMASAAAHHHAEFDQENLQYSSRPNNPNGSTHHHAHDQQNQSEQQSNAPANNGMPSKPTETENNLHGMDRTQHQARSPLLQSLVFVWKLCITLLYLVLSSFKFYGSKALSVLPSVLPWTAGLFGHRKAEAWLRTSLRHDAPNKEQRTVLLGFSAMLVIAGTWAGCTFSYYLILLSISVMWNLIICLWQVVSCCVELVVWKPTWIVAWPLSGGLLWQRHMQLPHVLWSFPIIWWASGGGWWAVAGTLVSFVLGVLGTGIFIGGIAWILICWELRYFSWWLSIPAILFTIFGWVFLCSAIVAAVQDEDESKEKAVPGKLSTVVPKGAGGEVARVLSCSDYFQVLELDETCTDGQVRKAKKLKALATHPDKLGDKAVGAALAFQRITEAADFLADEMSRERYAQELSRSSSSFSNSAKRPSADSSETSAGNMSQFSNFRTPSGSASACNAADASTRHAGKKHRRADKKGGRRR